MAPVICAPAKASSLASTDQCLTFQALPILSCDAATVPAMCIIAKEL